MKKSRSIKIISIAMLAIAGLAFAVPGGWIKGKIVAPEGATIYLKYEYAGREYLDSTKVKEQAFSFNTHFPEAVVCTLSNAINPQLRIFIGENRTIAIHGAIQQFHSMEVQDAPENRLYNIYQQNALALSGRYRQALKTTGAALRDTATIPYKAYKYSQDSLISAFVSQNSETAAAALAILEAYVQNPNKQAASKAYKLLSVKGKQTLYAARVKQFIESTQLIAPGKLAPLFELKNLNGETVKLKDFRGSYLFLDFWASWCPPCRAEHPLLKELHREYGKDKIKFLSLSMDAQEAAWRRAVKDDGLTWQQINDPKSTNGAVADIYGVKTLPFNCIIDPQGKIVATNLRGEKLRAFFLSLFP